MSDDLKTNGRYDLNKMLGTMRRLTGEYTEQQPFSFDRSYFFVKEDDDGRYVVKEIRFVDCHMRTTFSLATGERVEGAHEYYTYEVVDVGTSEQERYRLSNYDIEKAFTRREDAEAKRHEMIAAARHQLDQNFAEARKDLDDFNTLHGLKDE